MGVLGRRLDGAAAIAACALLAAPARTQQISDPAPTQDRERAIRCMTAAIAYEAGFEPIDGQQAIAEVILNRVLDPAYPKTVCGVVFAGSERRTGCQFTFTCDGALGRPLPRRVIEAARAVAIAALDARNPVRVGGATHYHADYVMPYWAPSLVRVGKIGTHIFYRRAGSSDQGFIPVHHAPRGEPLVSAALSAFGGSTSPEQPFSATAAIASPSPAPFAPWGLPIASR